MITGWAFLTNGMNMNLSSDGSQMSWFHFNQNGQMDVGWNYIDEKWYFFQNDVKKGVYGSIVKDNLNGTLSVKDYTNLNCFGKMPGYYEGVNLEIKDYIENEDGYILDVSRSQLFPFNPQPQILMEKLEITPLFHLQIMKCQLIIY